MAPIKSGQKRTKADKSGQIRVLVLLLLGLAFVPAPAHTQDAKNVLVVTASSGDYMFGAGGTLAKLVQEGYTINVAQFGNDEKITHGLSPAQARLANVEEFLTQMYARLGGCG